MDDKKVQRSSADVYNHIYLSIASGEFPMGSAISEMKVAQALGVSRSPVREALKKLQGEGIVTHIPNRGTFVTDLSVQDIRELYDLRTVLEIFAIKKLIAHLQDGLLEVFEGLEREFEDLNEESPLEEYHAANQKLHHMIIRASGNRRLESMYDLLNAQIAILNILSTSSSEDFVESKKEHLAIIRCILKKDPELAEELIVSHIGHIKENTVNRFLYSWEKVNG